MLDAGLIKAVRTAVESAVSPVKVDNVTITEGHNYDAENVLFIEIGLPRGTGPLSGPSYMQLLSSVNQILVRSGEERTPLFRTVREDEDEPEESEIAAPS